MDEIKPVACVDPVDLARISEPRETLIFAPEYKSSDDVMLYDQQAIDTLRAEVEFHKLDADALRAQMDVLRDGLEVQRRNAQAALNLAERAEAEAEALRKDAERYRWLRQNEDWTLDGIVRWHEGYEPINASHEVLDAAIDIARQEKQ